jgi:MFS family permease
MATIIALIGIPASMVLGEITAKRDRRRIMMSAATISLASSVLITFTVEGSYAILLILLLILGAFSYGRNASLVAGMMAASDPKLKGLYMAFYASVGFSGGIIAPPLVGMALDLAGGRLDAAGWSAGFLTLAIGGAITALGLLILARPRKK